MKWNETLAGLGSYKPGKREEQVKAELGLERIVKLSSNENPFGTSEEVRGCLRKLSYESLTELYPDGHAAALRKVVASFYQLEESELIFTAGVDELIGLLARALLRPDVNTVMATPTFVQYAHHAKICGAELREVPLLEDGAHDLEKMFEQIDENTAVVWICNPNNPTGNFLDLDAVEAFLKRVPKETLVVLDEAYIEYVEPVPRAHEHWIRTYPNLVITRTFSKIYGLASARVGYGMASPAIISQLNVIRSPFNTTMIGQALAIEALSDQDFIAKCRKENKLGIAQYEAFAEQYHEVKLYPSCGNFVLLEFQCSGQSVFRYLEEKGYITRSGETLGFPNAVRITIGRAEDNAEVIRLLAAFLR
ncbi:histidinol-phosphate transaminase [Listeria kieliensis]